MAHPSFVNPRYWWVLLKLWSIKCCDNLFVYYTEKTFLSTCQIVEALMHGGPKHSSQSQDEFQQHNQQSGQNKYGNAKEVFKNIVQCMSSLNMEKKNCIFYFD